MKADQPGLFDGQPPRAQSLPNVDIEHSQTRSILTKATGFMAAYDFTLNPYQGCTFGCSYCYAAFFVQEQAKTDSWGDWVVIKQSAAEAIRRLRRDIRGASIYMSSVTDPYQPIEKQTELTRSVLEALLPHQPRLVIQTRSPLVTRDIDLFDRFAEVRVNMTITTDDEAVRRAFEPKCPGNAKRLAAAADLVDAGIEVHITMTPLLPVRDPAAFATAVAATGASHYVVQPFHVGSGRFVAGYATGSGCRDLSSWVGRGRVQADRGCASAGAPKTRGGTGGLRAVRILNPTPGGLS
jgi:DNA repair photolyase